MRLQVEQIRRLLDACLATEDEVRAARAGRLEDPLWGDAEEEDGSSSESEDDES